MPLHRAFAPNFHRGVATPREREALAEAGQRDRAVQDFLAWRRATLVAALVLLLLTLVYDFWQHGLRDHPETLLTPRGAFVHHGIPFITGAICTIAVAMALMHWREEGRVRWFLWTAIGLAFATPFIVAAVPTEGLVHADRLKGIEIPALILREGRAPRSASSVALGVATTLLLVLPILSLLAGAFRAGRLVKTAVPESSAAGVVMVLLIPINLCAIVTACLLLLELDQDWLLLGAVAALSLTQVIYLVRARTLCAPVRREVLRDTFRRIEPVRLALLVIAAGLFIAFLVNATYLGRPLVGTEFTEPAPWFVYHRAVRNLLHFGVSYLLVLLVLADFTMGAVRAAVRSP